MLRWWSLLSNVRSICLVCYYTQRMVEVRWGQVILSEFIRIWIPGGKPVSFVFLYKVFLTLGCIYCNLLTCFLKIIFLFKGFEQDILIIQLVALVFRSLSFHNKSDYVFLGLIATDLRSVNRPIISCNRQRVPLREQVCARAVTWNKCMSTHQRIVLETEASEWAHIEDLARVGDKWQKQKMQELIIKNCC